MGLFMLREKLKTRQANISVTGLGYVGLPEKQKYLSFIVTTG